MPGILHATHRLIVGTAVIICFHNINYVMHLREAYTNTHAFVYIHSIYEHEYIDIKVHIPLARLYKNKQTLDKLYTLNICYNRKYI